MTISVAHTSARPRGLRVLAIALVVAAAALLAQTVLAAPASALTGVDLATYKRVGRHDLPEPTRTVPPVGNLLAQEASGVTYDWDTDSLFIVGDGGTSVTQVSKTGALIDSMTLAAGGSPQGTTFYDTEGIAYIGDGKFVMTEERDRQLVRFTYAAGTTLTRDDVDTVKLGTSIGNVGLEGLTNDPTSGGFVVVKEADPLSIFQTGIDWDAGTATNGSPAATGSTDLFDPALAGLGDFSDVFALSNLSTLSGSETSHLLILSQESGKIVNVDRAGAVSELADPRQRSRQPALDPGADARGPDDGRRRQPLHRQRERRWRRRPPTALGLRTLDGAQPGADGRGPHRPDDLPGREQQHRDAGQDRRRRGRRRRPRRKRR